MTQNASHELQPSRISPMTWGVIFSVTLIGAGLLARHFDWSDTATMLVLLLPMLLLIPLVRSAEAAQARSGCVSTAVRRYNRRMLLASFAYMLALFLAVILWKNHLAGGVFVWALAVLPSLGVLGMIRAMALYLREESDEYLRQRTVNASLIGLGLLLATMTIWGFFESFQLVPHVPGWIAVPVWAIGLGIGQMIERRRGA